mgnify:FL=1
MGNININFNGKEFLLSCEDGQEEHLEELSVELKKKFDDLKTSLGNIGENKLMLITSIQILDEYYETKKKIDEKKKELESLTEKFKELKSLVYEYKDEKEKQISNLNQDQLKLKEEIEKSKNEYENILDNATSELENFLKKANNDSIQ